MWEATENMYSKEKILKSDIKNIIKNIGTSSKRTKREIINRVHVYINDYSGSSFTYIRLLFWCLGYEQEDAQNMTEKLFKLREDVEGVKT